VKDYQRVEKVLSNRGSFDSVARYTLFGFEAADNQTLN